MVKKAIVGKPKKSKELSNGNQKIRPLPANQMSSQTDGGRKNQAKISEKEALHKGKIQGFQNKKKTKPADAQAAGSNVVVRTNNHEFKNSQQELIPWKKSSEHRRAKKTDVADHEKADDTRKTNKIQGKKSTLFKQSTPQDPRHQKADPTGMD